MKEIDGLNPGGSNPLETPGNSIQIIQVTNKQVLGKALGTGRLSDLYREAFGQEPYFETYTDEDVQGIFEGYVDHGLLFLAQDGEITVGFEAALSFSTLPTIAEALSETNVDTSTASYMADLGVKQEYRRKGIADALVQKHLSTVASGTTVVTETRADNLRAQNFYVSVGFTPLEGVLRHIPQDGDVAPHDTVFLIKTP